jgi:ElaB/YqjD/DUF883 family membrane-anchored ribosome-binding protein
MDQLINQNLEDREQTRAALTQKLEALEIRLRDSAGKVKEAIRNSTDISYQVKQRPWGMFGLSVMLGCAAGRLMSCRSSGYRSTVKDSADKLTSSVERGLESLSQVAKSAGLGEYANQIGVLKGATIGAIASLLSELARQAVSTVLAQLENYTQNKLETLNNKTTNVSHSVSG